MRQIFRYGFLVWAVIFGSMILLCDSCSNQTCQVKDLPFNKYSWIVTHNAFSILGEPSLTGAQRITPYNQEDSVTNQLKNGVRGLMLDMYDFRNHIWLCHSTQGKCFNFTAFRPAITTLKEIEAFLTDNPTEIVTIIIEDYVRAPKGLTNLFTSAGLLKFMYPISEMPNNGKDCHKIGDMVSKNWRLLVFSSNASKEAEEGIAYQWKYLLKMNLEIQGWCKDHALIGKNLSRWIQNLLLLFS